MTFEQWIGEVGRELAVSHPGVTTERLDGNAMYQAWVNGVSATVFVNASRLPLKEVPSFDIASANPPLPSVAAHKMADFDIGKNGGPPRPPLQHGRARVGATSQARYIPLILLLTIAFSMIIILTLNANPTNGSDILETFEADSSAKASRPAPSKPLSDAQKLDRATQAYASWTGDEDVYEANVALLKEIAEKSEQFARSGALLTKWAKRKKDSDARKEKQAQQAAARQRELDRLAAIASLKREKDEAQSYTGDGDVKVAIGEIDLRRSTGSHVAYDNSTFVYVFVSVLNAGSETMHANPNDFTLADSDGNTAPHESDTYALGNYFDAVNLRPGQQTGGWLIFLMRKDKRYTLTRTGGFSGPDVIKQVIP